MTKKKQHSHGHDHEDEDDDAVELHDEHFKADQPNQLAWDDPSRDEGEAIEGTTNPVQQDDAAEVVRLRAYIKTIIKQDDLRPPCPLCGYAGPNFYDPTVHSCADKDNW